MERRGLDRLFPPLPFFLELRGPGIVDASRNERATSVTGIACRNGPVSVTLVLNFNLNLSLSAALALLSALGKDKFDVFSLIFLL
jgi:hypothetical protein